MDRPADAELERHYEAVKSRAGRAGLGLGGGETASRDVADHYNSLADRHRTLDSGSQILHVRNLHNWIKAVLIGRHMRPGHAVLDMACGKGGDMLKFKAGNCAHYVGVDIAAQSVCDAVARYNGSHGRGGMPFPAHFVAADICDGALETAFPPGVTFDLVSCQFALHYAFSSAARARGDAQRRLPPQARRRLRWDFARRERARATTEGGESSWLLRTPAIFGHACRSS